MRSILVAMLVGAPAVAAAERTTAVTIQTMFGGVERATPSYDLYAPRMTVTGGPRVTLSWENAPIALPPKRGYAFAGDLVPELTAGLLMTAERGEAFLGVGARGELKVGQREGGMLRINARLAFYLAARAIVIGRAQDTLGELAFGEYIYLGSSRIRLGGEIAVTVREAPAHLDDRQMGAFASLYLGWAL